MNKLELDANNTLASINNSSVAEFYTPIIKAYLALLIPEIRLVTMVIDKDEHI